MCKVGDIIVVKNYISQGRALNRHSFVILNADRGEIQGLDYDLVCNVMSSFHSEADRLNLNVSKVLQDALADRVSQMR